jgi:hypothetical protein
MADLSCSLSFSATLDKTKAIQQYRVSILMDSLYPAYQANTVAGDTTNVTHYYASDVSNTGHSTVCSGYPMAMTLSVQKTSNAQRFLVYAYYNQSMFLSAASVTANFRIMYNTKL